MAKTLEAPVVAIDLKGVVDTAVENVRAVRNLRAVKLETEFQRQVADGLSYEAQVDYLTNQLDKEQASSFASKDIVKELEKRIADTKRLKRFNAYRTKYQDLLQELKAGKVNAQTQLGQLKNLLSTSEDDSDLRLEIEADITAMEQEVKAADDAMIQNQLKRAQYDGTERVLNDAISLVKDKRSKSLLAGLDEEASAYDVWLTVLGKQLNETKVTNAISDIDVRVATKGMNATAKVDELNNLIRGADGSTAITLDGVTYDSARDYFTNLRDSYIAGTGSGLFADYFKEIDGEYTERINAAVKRDGLVTAVVFDRIKSEFADLKNRAEFKPFLERVQNYESLTQGAAMDSTAASIVDRTAITGDYAGADRALQSYATKYGVNVDAYRMQLSAQAEQRAAEIYSASDGTISMEEARKKLGVDTILTPEDPGFQVPGVDEPGATEAERAAAGGTSRFAGAVGYGGASVVDFLKMAGQDTSYTSRAALAAERGISNYTGSSAQNIQLLNLLKQEAVATPAPAPAPKTDPKTTKVETPAAPAKTTPAQPSTPVKTTPASTPAKPVTPAPAPGAAPAAPAKTGYQGASIVDYLKTTGQDASFATRSTLAKQKGITNYTGSAEQNTQLLKSLRGY